jgi:glycosyltransferase involved in cell wall biosynthesis
MKKLSVVIITKDSSRWVERLLLQTQLYADELIILVDRASSDNTYDICKQYANRVEFIETPGYVEPVLNYAYSLAHYPWCLRVDDDELLGTRFVEMKQEILDLPQAACWLPRYNVVGAEMNHYLSTWPLYPDYQVRLFRKNSLNQAPVIHTTPAIYGETCELESVHLFHLNLLLKSRGEREQLVKHYDTIRPGAGSGTEYRAHYLPEELLSKSVRECEELIAVSRQT